MCVGASFNVLKDIPNWAGRECGEFEQPEHPFVRNWDNGSDAVDYIDVEVPTAVIHKSVAV